MMGRYGHGRPDGPRKPAGKPAPVRPFAKPPRGAAYYAAARSGKLRPLGCLAYAIAACVLVTAVLLTVVFSGSGWDEPPPAAIEADLD
jgi:hypothetical protein